MTISNRQVMAVGVGGFALLLLGALWILLRAPAGSAATAHSLSATNPALELRYSYDPGVFKPAPFDAHAEFPLQLDAGDWSFYGKRLQGIGGLLVKEAQPVVYRFISESSTAIYSEFYHLEFVGKSSFEEISLGGKPAVRQQLRLHRGAKSLDWPECFPLSITAGQSASLVPPKEAAERAFALPQSGEAPPAAAAAAGTPATDAWVYAWALFHGEDLYLFQAVAPRELGPAEIRQAEALIDGLKFGALRGAAASDK